MDHILEYTITLRRCHDHVDGVDYGIRQVVDVGRVHASCNANSHDVRVDVGGDLVPDGVLVVQELEHVRKGFNSWSNTLFSSLFKSENYLRT